MSLEVTAGEEGNGVGEKEEDERERVHEQSQVAQEAGERRGVEVLSLEVPGGSGEAVNEEKDEAQHHRDHAQRRHTHEETGVLQEREDDDDDGENELENETVRGFGTNLEGKLAHEVRHGDLAVNKEKEGDNRSR